MIEEINTLIKIKLAPSKLHGIGVFALRDLEQYEKLFADMFPKAFKIKEEDVFKLMPEIYDLLIDHWPGFIKNGQFMYPYVHFISFINHSDNPNYDLQTDELLKDVKKDEEITADYRQFKNWEDVYPFLK